MVAFIVILFAVGIIFFIISWEKATSSKHFYFYEEDIKKFNYHQHFKVYFNEKRSDFAYPEGIPMVIYKPALTVVVVLLFGIIVVAMLYIFMTMVSGNFILNVILACILLIPVSFFIISLLSYTSKIYVYKNCIIIKDFLKERVYYYRQLDSIESNIEIEMCGNRAGGFTVFRVYNLIKDGCVVHTLHCNHYENLSDIETAFTGCNPYVKSIINTGFQEVDSSIWRDWGDDD